MQHVVHKFKPLSTNGLFLLYQLPYVISQRLLLRQCSRLESTNHSLYSRLPLLTAGCSSHFCLILLGISNKYSIELTSIINTIFLVYIANNYSTGLLYKVRGDVYIYCRESRLRTIYRTPQGKVCKYRGPQPSPLCRQQEVLPFLGLRFSAAFLVSWFCSSLCWCL